VELSSKRQAEGMTPFRNIIVAYDGSDRAQDALALGLRLRDPDGGRMTLACALVERPWGPHHASDDVPEEIGMMLAAARAQVPIGIHVALRAPAASSAARALTELAETEHADLLVIGSSRRIGDGRIHLERTAGRLLQGAPCAVAVAPAGLRTQDPFRHIGIAYDGSNEARVALAAGYAIAQASGAAATVAYAHVVVTSDGDDLAMRERLRAQRLLDDAADAAPAGVNPRTLLLHGPAAAVIARACEDVVDLLVCGSRGYGPIERALIGSVAESLMEGAPHPVLVLPRKTASAGAQAAPIAVAVQA
jgi:nucleotide-binding universal stress UspA family protein